MKAGILQEAGKLVISEVPDPRIENGSVIVRVRVCSICGTDLRVFRHGHPKITFPQIIGHEIVGEIAAIGPGVAGLKVGGRVAVTPRVSCGRCFYCQRGQAIYCMDSRTFGFQMQGGFAQYMLIQEEAVKFGVINSIDDLSFKEASLAEPLACCLRAQKAAQVGKGQIVIVIGGGPVGIIHCRLAKANGALKVVLLEKDPDRIKDVDLSAVDELIDPVVEDVPRTIARLTDSKGADVVIVACSSVEAQQQALGLVGRGGTVNFFGGLPAGEPEIRIDSNMVHYKEICIRGSHSGLPADNQDALDLLIARKLQIGDLVTHTYPLDRIAEAFEFAESRKGMRVAVCP